MASARVWLKIVITIADEDHHAAHDVGLIRRAGAAGC